MDLTKILSIAGRSGLFKVISQTKNALIVESLSDQKRFPVFSHERMSTLEEISIFTTGEDKPLKEILKAFHDKLGQDPAPDPKSDPKALNAFFGETVPDYDKDRVYFSDIKKISGWYNQLLEHNLLDFSEEEKSIPEEKKEDEKASPEA